IPAPLLPATPFLPFPPGITLFSAGLTFASRPALLMLRPRGFPGALPMLACHKGDSYAIGGLPATCILTDTRRKPSPFCETCSPVRASSARREETSGTGQGAGPRQLRAGTGAAICASCATPARRLGLRCCNLGSFVRCEQSPNLRQ